MPLPPVQQILGEHLAALRDQRDNREPLGQIARASSAGRCSRAIGFQIAGLEPTNPPSIDSLVNFFIGDAIHDAVQRAILARFPDASSEQSGQIEDYIIGHCDVLYRAEDNEQVLCEIKTVSDFAFEAATGIELRSNGRWRRKEKVIEGAKREHKLQAGIYAIMFQAKYIAVVYVRKTAAKDEPVIYEWRYKTEDLSEEIYAEIERLKEIVLMVRDNRIPARIFEDKEIVDPSKVKWPCSYCGHLEGCISLGAGEVKIK